MVYVVVRYRGACWHSGRCAVYVPTSVQAEVGLHWRQAATRHMEQVATYCTLVPAKTASSTIR